MDKSKLEEMKKKYELTDEQTLASAKIIYDQYTYGKNNSKAPFAIIVIGQAGAGKSGLMCYSANQFESAVALDIDDLRAYYPRYDEVAKEDAQVFEAVTGAFATKIILTLTPTLVENGYDLILHKTRGDKAIIDDTINYLKDNNYNVVMRVMAVHALESKMSALERSLAQYDKTGFCRWVETPYHDKHYAGIVDLTEFLSDNGYSDATEVFVRGKNPVLPPKVYGKISNYNIVNNTNLLNENGVCKIQNYNSNNYLNIREAIEKTRENGIPEILKTLPDRIQTVVRRPDYNNTRAPEFVEEIMNNVSTLNNATPQVREAKTALNNLQTAPQKQ